MSIRREEHTIEERPFHEAIVEAIQLAPYVAARILANLIKATEISGNHDQIIKAWRTKWGSDFNVPEIVRGKKLALAEESRVEKSSCSSGK